MKTSPRPLYETVRASHIDALSAVPKPFWIVRRVKFDDFHWISSSIDVLRTLFPSVSSNAARTKVDDTKH